MQAGIIDVMNQNPHYDEYNYYKYYNYGLPDDRGNHYNKTLVASTTGVPPSMVAMR